VTFPFGLLIGFLMGDLTWQGTEWATANLPGGARPLALLPVAVAVLTGLLAGSSACRRVRAGASHPVLFSALAFAVAGGLTGAALLASVTGLYIASYGVSPADTIAQVATVAVYPLAALLGLAAGGAAAAPAGLVAGAGLRRLYAR